jgi:thymidylate synthase (FAD)
MDKIQIKVLETHGDPGQWSTFLARLTQRGHNIKNMDDLEELFNKSHTPGFVEAIAKMPHGTIKRFTPITIAIVGASRRFLAQARTSQVGTNFVSASLQYSDYSGEADFVVPYALYEKQQQDPTVNWPKAYLESCRDSMDTYQWLASNIDNDTAGYAAPQGLRNILIMQGNHQAWDYFIRMRSCNRNTVETQYVTTRIWEELLKTPYGQEFFGYSGADCMHGVCREGKMCCANPMRKYYKKFQDTGISVPRLIINDKWPLLNKEDTNG